MQRTIALYPREAVDIANSLRFNSFERLSAGKMSSSLVSTAQRSLPNQPTPHRDFAVRQPS